MAQLGKNVLMIDLDPQCNLTGSALEVGQSGLLPKDYQSYAQSNLHSALKPAMKGTGEKIKTPDVIKVRNQERLWILPGNVRMAEVETQLATAMNMGAVMPAMQNVPGSFGNLYTLLNKKYKLDYILLDLSPSLGALNQVNLLLSDYFIVPMMPDIFSVMAIDSLSRVLPDWARWAEKINRLELFDDRDMIYKFTPSTPKFLGTVVQNYNVRNKLPTQSFRRYMESLQNAVVETLIPALSDAGMVLNDNVYSQYDVKYELAEIPNFNSLIATAQTCGKPIYQLAESELTTSGAAAKGQMENVLKFNEIFTNLAKQITGTIEAI